MEKIKILIADTNTEFTDRIQHCFHNFSDIELIGVARSGMEALHIIRSEHPDAVVFDLLLPELDGISLLRSINALPDAPATICCTSFCSDVALEAVRRFRASYLMYKPIELHSLHAVLISCIEMQRLLQRKRHIMIEDSSDSAVQSAFIRNYIVSLGVPTKLIGCSYLAEAVRLARMDSSLLRNLSKGLYLEIANNMNTTAARIERCIRSAIKAAYCNGSLRLQMPETPSNKEFINYILRNLADQI